MCGINSSSEKLGKKLLITPEKGTSSLCREPAVSLPKELAFATVPSAPATPTSLRISSTVAPPVSDSPSSANSPPTACTDGARSKPCSPQLRVMKFRGPGLPVEDAADVSLPCSWLPRGARASQARSHLTGSQPARIFPGTSETVGAGAAGTWS